MSDLLRLVGEQLRAIRLAKGLTQQEVAEKADTSDTRISDIERGKINISLISLEKIMIALDISPSELFNFSKLNIETGIEEKKMILEIQKSLLMERGLDEIKYVYRTTKDFLDTMDHMKDHKGKP